MIKNSVYTYDYFQPKEYRFSLDSVFLAQFVAGAIATIEGRLNVLDLCAGCGIIGLELSLHAARNDLAIDFLEVQSVYRDYFEKNLKMIYPETDIERFRFLEKNYRDLLSPDWESHYDLIVCNPPYFFLGEGLLSPNDFKNRCRFFMDSDFETLIKSICHALKSGGSAYLLVRSGSHHGRDPETLINSLLDSKATAKIVQNIRGTDVFLIRKKDL